ncbi:MAG: flagellar biosynthesis anti-sigma factor FlgM [Clostridium sp.]|uniref:flagellar biosynthesis anti-sigma factor FlgM n=1 Tax=Clostridium sp. TaxID=1506 RepID=UPI002908E550|nr:flagellar biosynthesis anti-sigma factor FlgM [Clostridium sp.]MDU5110482.1 flagellar biosynthesis anti-sigma factor FlgM [Clostridium sp.]
MNIKGINYSNGIDYYKNKTINNVNKVKTERTYDRIELSDASKALRDYGIDRNFDNKKRVAEVKNEISNGTYSYDARLIAKGILDSMRGND